MIRQSVKTNFEAPFLYLLFGKDRALLLDTGAGGLKIRPTDRRAIATGWPRITAPRSRWSSPTPTATATTIRATRSSTTVPTPSSSAWTPPEVAAFFKIADWPHDIVKFDLGGRTLDVIPTPGHQPSHIMVFDERTRLLLSGDSLYPGRLYVPSNMFADFRASIDRVVAFTKHRRVAHVLGAHIEMTDAPARISCSGAQQHPHERALELPYADLL